MMMFTIGVLDLDRYRSLSRFAGVHEWPDGTQMAYGGMVMYRVSRSSPDHLERMKHHQLVDFDRQAADRQVGCWPAVSPPTCNLDERVFALPLHSPGSLFCGKSSRFVVHLTGSKCLILTDFCVGYTKTRLWPHLALLVIEHSCPVLLRRYENYYDSQHLLECHHLQRSRPLAIEVPVSNPNAAREKLLFRFGIVGALQYGSVISPPFKLLTDTSGNRKGPATDQRFIGCANIRHDGVEDISSSSRVGRS
nr:hypothetical protein CFP56_04138 [Quercus suber]